jgi:hypothetical protein
VSEKWCNSPKSLTESGSGLMMTERLMGVSPLETPVSKYERRRGVQVGLQLGHLYILQRPFTFPEGDLPLTTHVLTIELALPGHRISLPRNGFGSQATGSPTVDMVNRAQSRRCWNLVDVPEDHDGIVRAARHRWP